MDRKKAKAPVEPTTFTLTPIGVVHSELKKRGEVSLYGHPADIEIYRPYLEALDDLETCSHIIVLGVLHRADRGVLRARPRKFDPTAEERGVFATRSPDRPNPLSVTVVPLVRRKGRVLRVAHLDLIDGTPVVDIKPYSAGWDSIFCAKRERKFRPDTYNDSRLIEILQRDLENQMGEAAASDTARLVLISVFVAVRSLHCDPRDPELSVTANRCDETIDALMGLTGAAFHNRRIGYRPGGKNLRLAFRAKGKRLILTETSGWRAALDDPARWRDDVFEAKLEDV